MKTINRPHISTFLSLLGITFTAEPARAQLQFFANSPGEASTALPIDLNADGVPDRMLTGDNEDETLRFYPFTGGATAGTAVNPASSFIVTQNAAAAGLLNNCTEATAIARCLGLAAPAVTTNLLRLDQVNRILNNPNTPNDNWNIRETDIESSARIGDHIYWLGSHSLANNLEERFVRHRLFVTDLTINAGNPVLTFVNYYSQLRTELVNWDNARPVGRRYNFAASITGVGPEADSGFNIEGMTATEVNTLFIGFRSPLVDPFRYNNAGTTTQIHRTHAIVMEITNPSTLIAAAGQPPSTAAATFGRTYELDLGGRGIRSMDYNGTDYVILAGRVNNGGQADDFAVYTWRPGIEPMLRFAAVPAGFNAETVMIRTTGSLAGAFNVRLVADSPPAGNPADPRSQISTFSSFDVAVPAAGAFHFAPVCDVMVHDSARGFQRRVDVTGFVATGASLPTLAAQVLSGASLVTGLSVVQPTVGNPHGSILFTPSNAGGVAASGEIRVTATIPGASYVRDFKVYRFNSYRTETVSAIAPDSLALLHMNNLGAALGHVYTGSTYYQGQPMTWNQRSAFAPLNDLLPATPPVIAEGFNDFGAAVGGSRVWLNGNTGPFTLTMPGGISIERQVNINNRNRSLVCLDGDQVVDRWVMVDLTGTVTGSQANIAWVTTIGASQPGSTDITDLDREGNCGGYEYTGIYAQACMWTASNNYAGAVFIPLTGTGLMSQVFCVSSNGVAGGYEIGNPWVSHATVWRRTGPSQWASPVVFAPDNAYSYAVNDDHQVLMQHYNGSVQYAVGDGALTGGGAPTWTFWGAGPMPAVYIRSLNNRGQITGRFSAAGNSAIYTPLIAN